MEVEKQRPLVCFLFAASHGVGGHAHRACQPNKAMPLKSHSRGTTALLIREEGPLALLALGCVSIAVPALFGVLAPAQARQHTRGRCEGRQQQTGQYGANTSSSACARLPCIQSPGPNSLLALPFDEAPALGTAGARPQRLAIAAHALFHRAAGVCRAAGLSYPDRTCAPAWAAGQLGQQGRCSVHPNRLRPLCAESRRAPFNAHAIRVRIEAILQLSAQVSIAVGAAGGVGGFAGHANDGRRAFWLAGCVALIGEGKGRCGGVSYLSTRHGKQGSFG